MSKKFAHILLICTCYLTKISAQIDIGFQQYAWPNTLWSGDVQKFGLFSEQLQLMDWDPQGNNNTKIHLYAPTTFDTITHWYFDWKMDFSPSASNYSKIWLCSNISLDQIEAGYYLRMGGYSGDSDALKLFYFDGVDDLEIGSSLAGYMHGDQVHRELKVERSLEGEWLIYSREAGVGDFQLLFEAFHKVEKIFEFVSIECIYTLSRNEHFFLDSIYLNPLYEDIEAPKLIDWNFASGQRLVLDFDEDISESVPFFRLDDQDYEPDYALDQTQLTIYTEDELADGQYFKLEIDGIKDLKDNVSATFSLESFFKYIGTIQVGDILISEIFFEPSKSENPLAPDWEFIELYNRSPHALDLSQLYLEYNGSAFDVNLPLVEPNTFVVLSPSEDVNAHSNFFFVDNFPSLLNSGAQLDLYSDGGVLIDRIYFGPSLYGDEDRDHGGYSLERINLDNPCLSEKNWRACQYILGVSPGYSNSVQDSLYFPNPTMELLAVEEEGNSLILKSSHLLSDHLDVQSILIDPDLSVSSGSTFFDQSGKLELHLHDPMIRGVEYKLMLDDGLSLCDGMSFNIDDLIMVGIGILPQPGDLIFNEFMHDPLSGCTPFIEIANVSDSLIDGSDLFIEFRSNTQEFVFPIPKSMISKQSYPVIIRDSIEVNNCYAHLDLSHSLTTDLFKSIAKDSFELFLYHLEGDYSINQLAYLTYNVNDRGDAIQVRGKSYERLANGEWLTAPAPHYSSPTQANQSLSSNNLEHNQPFSLDPPLLSGSSPFFNLRYNLDTKVSNYDIIIAAAGIPLHYNIESEINLSGSGSMLLESIPWDYMKNGVYFMIIKEVSSQSINKRWLIPFFVYL